MQFSIKNSWSKTREEQCNQNVMRLATEQLFDFDNTVTVPFSVPTRSASDHQYCWCSRTKTVNMTQTGHGVLCHNPEGHWRWLTGLVYDCTRKQRIKQTVSMCSIRLPALLFLLWNQITAAPPLGETISKPWDGGVIEEVKGESKLILSDRQASFIYILV